MDGKRYNSLNCELKNIFGEKVMKLSLDGGFTCPNRDGKVDTRGCIFCGEDGSGEFAGDRANTIKEQIEGQKGLLSRKWKATKYIAYFQNFTNTYASLEYLSDIYNEALEEDGVVGLAIATRPDCLQEEVLNLLDTLNKKTFLWVELGLQTIHEESANFIRRGYTLDVFETALEELKKRNIKVVTHLIIGLPNEEKEDILKSVKFISEKNIWGIKFHSLYIQKDTDLAKYYYDNPFSIMSMEEYITTIVDSLEILPKTMVIHRLTGDGKKELIISPKWSLNKAKVLTSIDKELKERNSYQGKKGI